MSASKKTAGVSTLPQDILIEILSKLPAKSLVRFRCVSKFFCALIADHGFGVLHRSLSLTLPSRTGVLISIESRTPHAAARPRAYYTLNFSEEENPRSRGMLQANRIGYLDAEPFLCSSSSDGLIICVSRPNRDVVVCNVSTGQRIFLPRIQYEDYALLLGYDSESKRYKVLMSVCEEDSRGINEYKHWVFTVGVDKSWREINNNCSHPFYPFDSYRVSNTSVYIDGVIYSYSFRAKPRMINRFHIVAFEVGCEIFSVITLPDEFSSLHYSSSIHYQASLFRQKSALLEVDGGRLAMVLLGKLRGGRGLCYMNVWTWEKITITIPMEWSRMINNARLLRFATNRARKIVLLFIYSQQIFILVCYLKSKVWKKFDVNGVEEFSTFNSWVVTGVVEHVFPLE